jgi:hypothetical protein
VAARPQGVPSGPKGPTVTPLVSTALVEYLERTFPDTLPSDATESIDSVRFRSGSRHVVGHLHDRQQRDPFTTAVTA